MKMRSICLILCVIFFISLPVHAAPISGTYVGIFTDPMPQSPPSVTTGIGTDSITWGTPCDGVTNCTTSPGGITPPSSLTFTALSFSTEIGVPFVLGELEFFNGTVMPGTEISQVTLLLDGFMITPNQFAGPDSRDISIVNTTNNDDPIASADRVTLPMAFFPAAYTFGVLESQSATATILGEFTEISPEFLDLNILGFGEATDPDGFIEDPAPVPLPSAIWLLGCGLIGLAGIRKKSKKYPF